MNPKFINRLRLDLSEIEASGLYKTERIISSAQGAEIEVNGKTVLNFCANNYLGLSSHPKVLEAAKKYIDYRGYGMSSVRFICGTQDIHKELEQKISSFLGTEDTILYAAAFDANGGVFEPLFNEEDAIISDALNHASIIDGVRLCKAQRYRYEHNNMADLEVKLKESSKLRSRIIVTDGSFSMDGTIAQLDKICDLADQYDAIVMIDECHSSGFLGKTGRGTHEYRGVMGRIDIITDTLILRYDSQADLSDFNNKVSIHALLKDTRLYPEDISLFTQGLETWKKPLMVNGRFSGRVNHFVFSPMEILIGNSAVRGKVEMDGLPAIRETFINAGLSPSVVDPADIAFLLPSNVAASLGGLGTIKMHGSFIGFITDFVANGDFNTRFGNIKSDINYKISEDIGQTAYSGNLQLAEFDLGRFLGDTVNFQHVSMKGKISGKGFTEKTADFILNGDISSIGLLGYNYTNIQSNARFANQFFNGALKIDDPNLQFDMLS